MGALLPCSERHRISFRDVNTTSLQILQSIEEADVAIKSFKSKKAPIMENTLSELVKGGESCMVKYIHHSSSPQKWSQTVMPKLKIGDHNFTEYRRILYAARGVRAWACLCIGRVGGEKCPTVEIMAMGKPENKKSLVCEDQLTLTAAHTQLLTQAGIVTVCITLQRNSHLQVSVRRPNSFPHGLYGDPAEITISCKFDNPLRHFVAIPRRLNRDFRGSGGVQGIYH